MAKKIFSLEVLRARKGDCLLLHYGTTTKPGLALIDGGPDDVYQPFLRPRLEELRTERGISDDEELPLDLLMLSHIDDDHVAGLLELTQELRTARGMQKPEFVRILNLWHNTFDDIIDNDADELAGAVDGAFGPASRNGDLPAEIRAELETLADTADVADTVKVVASVRQGRELRNDARVLEIDLNVELGGDLVVASDTSRTLDIGKGLEFTVVGPMLPEVKKLQTEIRAWLREHPDEQERVTASALAALPDKSPSNLSSLVVLAQAQGKKILFTGDARGDKILKGLELVGLVDAGGTIEVDVLKVQHHGSDRNVTPEFFERVVAKDYVFSGNGEHGNPERTTLEMLAAARGDADYRIHLTYPVDEIDGARKKDWDSNRASELEDREEDPDKVVRPKWSAAKHSLTAFFDENPDVRKKIAVVQEGVPHIIDLLGD